jgi:hypothetical protein
LHRRSIALRTPLRNTSAGSAGFTFPRYLGEAAIENAVAAKTGDGKRRQVATVYAGSRKFRTDFDDSSPGASVAPILRAPMAME